MRKKSFKVELLASAILLAVPASAFAETAASNNGVEEVVVTAQHRRENVQKASVSIEVVSGSTLAQAGVTQATDLPRLSPGVQITQGGASLQIYIRGAGDFSATPINNAAVAPNIDGVYQARTQSVAGTLYDLERVEILKGPQGTLYGRNASGGALNIIPAKPKLGEFGGFAQVGVQNYNGFNFEGAVNLPAGENSAFRIATQIVSREGYVSNGGDDDKHESGRIQYLYRPNDDLSIRVMGNYQHIGGKGPGYVVYEPNGTAFSGPIMPSDPWTSIDATINPLIDIFNNVVLGAPGLAHLDTTKAYQDITTWGLHGTLDYNLGFATLTVIPSYQKVEVDSWAFPTLSYKTKNDATGGVQESESKSLEVRLGNTGDKMKWVAGAYYFSEDQTDDTSVFFGPLVYDLYTGDLTTESYAAFGEVTYSVTDNLRLIGGLRYTQEEKTVDVQRYAGPGTWPDPVNPLLPGCPSNATAPCPTSTIVDTYKANRTNFRVGFEYDITDQNMIFATVATGFKSGGQAPSKLPNYAPEDITAYTIGSRNRFFDNSLQLNLELFYNQYEGHQENITAPDLDGIVGQTLINAGEAESYGVSVDAVYRPTKNDQLRLAFEYNKAEYNSFVYNSYGPPPSTGCPFAAVAAGVWEIDCSGYQMARTPLWSGSLSYSHTIDLTNGGHISVNPDLSFATSRWVHPSFVPNVRVEGYTLYNFNVQYHSPGDKYSVTAFVNNIGNEAVYNGGEQHPMVAGYVGLNISPPRTYGLRAKVNF